MAIWALDRRLLKTGPLELMPWLIRVYDELKDQRDNLAEWVGALPGTLSCRPMRQPFAATSLLLKQVRAGDRILQTLNHPVSSESHLGEMTGNAPAKNQLTCIPAAVVQE